MTTGSERRWKDIGVNGDQNEASSRDPRHLGDMVTSVKLPRPLTQEKPYVIAMNGDERAPNRDRRRLENGHGRIPTHRTVSSPMMPAFMVSAPGKVIVFGEHAVVYGKVGARHASMIVVARVNNGTGGYGSSHLLAFVLARHVTFEVTPNRDPTIP